MCFTETDMWEQISKFTRTGIYQWSIRHPCQHQDAHCPLTNKLRNLLWDVDLWSMGTSTPYMGKKLVIQQKVKNS